MGLGIFRDWVLQIILNKRKKPRSTSRLLAQAYHALAGPFKKISTYNSSYDIIF